MFQTERQQDRELESLLVQYGEEKSGKPPLPPPDVLHSVWEKKDAANVPG